MIVASTNKVDLIGQKEELQEDLENIFLVLTIASGLFSTKEIIKILNKKTKKKNRITKYFEKKKRMKELDILLMELRRKNK